MLEKLSMSDINILIKALNFVLNSGEYDGELSTRIGVDDFDLQVIYDCLKKIPIQEIKIDSFVDSCKFPRKYIALGIHNTLSDVAYAMPYDNKKMKKKWGFTQEEVGDVFEKWILASEMKPDIS